MKRMIIYLGIFCLMLSVTSCINTKKLACFKDMEEGNLYSVSVPGEIKIKSGDRLRIVLGSRNPELTVPFNQLGQSVRVTSTGEITKGTAGSNTARSEKGYVVALDGCIEYPLLGKIPVLGLTKDEAAGKIKQLLADSGLIANAMVYIDVLNVRITVMGEVGTQGVLETEDRITLIEAIAKMRGLTNNANYKKVAVIREEDGGRKVYMHDIRSSAVFESPCYYLQQNDIVYVYPRYARSTVKEDRSLRFYSLGIGFISFIISMTALLK